MVTETKELKKEIKQLERKVAELRAEIWRLQHPAEPEPYSNVKAWVHKSKPGDPQPRYAVDTSGWANKGTHNSYGGG